MEDTVENFVLSDPETYSVMDEFLNLSQDEGKE